MLNRSIVPVMLSLAVAAGCAKKDDKGGAPEPTGEVKAPAVTPTPKPVETPPAVTTSTMPNKMANCPNSVEGAETEVTDGEGSVQIKITAKDAKATDEIRKRAAFLAHVQDAESAKVTHTGKGTGGGGLGKCPVILKDTKIDAAVFDGGVMITVRPADESKLGELKAHVNERVAAMKEPAAPAAPAAKEAPAPE